MVGIRDPVILENGKTEIKNFKLNTKSTDLSGIIPFAENNKLN